MFAYSTLNSKLTSVIGFQMLWQLGTIPPDKPICGFHGELCKDKHQIAFEKYGVQIIVSFVIAAIIVT